MSTLPTRRPGGRSERVRQAVLAAADDLADSGEEVTVAALAARSGVSEVTIYRRWRTADHVLLDAAVRDTSRRLPLTPTGNLRHDLTRWAQDAERSLATPRGRRLLAAVGRITLSPDGAAPAASARPYLQQRAAEIQQLIDAADPPAQITVPDVLDRVLAPLYLRQLFGYTPASRHPDQLVAGLLAGT
jgi:AcrR family transcriptional regulator